MAVNRLVTFFPSVYERTYVKDLSFSTGLTLQKDSLFKKNYKVSLGFIYDFRNDILHTAAGEDLSSLRLVICGGSAVPSALMRAFDERYGVPIVQLWGMTELSPLGTVSRLKRRMRDASAEEKYAARLKAGIPVPGIEMRIEGPNGDARIEIEPGQLDPRLKLTPCRRIEPYLPTGSTAWGRTRVGLRCLQGPTRWNVYLPVTVRV